MQRIFMYAHGGSGNHGCEAIVRSTADILSGRSLTLISSNPEEDRKYGVDTVCSLLKDRSDAINKKSLGFLKAYTALKLSGNYIPMDKLWYEEAFSAIRKGDIALSIGGDNYCYADVNKYVMLHDMLKKRGAKTVLWGCSVEPSVAARPEIAADLARYDLITARETITYEALKKINPNTVLVADPAFCLKPSEIPLPQGFVPGNTVGLNLSPMAMDLEKSPGIAFENYKNLISYIIEHTDMQVALIPHVVWSNGDDRIPLKRLYDAFAQTGRVILVDDHNCQEQKYLISQCRFFIGARTHATIAAYSTLVPTLVLGYSVKSRGIAADLFGTSQNYVLPVQQLHTAEALTEAFIRLMDHKPQIRCHLANVMPDYIAEATQIRKHVESALTP